MWMAGISPFQQVAGVVQFDHIGATQASASLTIETEKALKAW